MKLKIVDATESLFEAFHFHKKQIEKNKDIKNFNTNQMEKHYTLKELSVNLIFH